jgi:hypothetical protein
LQYPDFTQKGKTIDNKCAFDEISTLCLPVCAHELCHLPTIHPVRMRARVFAFAVVVRIIKHFKEAVV